METICNYDDSENENDPADEPSVANSSVSDKNNSSFRSLCAAPQTLALLPTEKTVTTKFVSPFVSSAVTTISRNLKADILLAPEAGPSNPFSGGHMGHRRHGSSAVQEMFVEDSYFNESYHSYLVDGENENKTMEPRSKLTKEERLLKKRRMIEIQAGESIGDESQGPWIPEAEKPAEEQLQLSKLLKDNETKESAVNDENDDEEDAIYKLPGNMHIVEPDSEAEKWERVNERKQKHMLPPRPNRGEIAFEAKSVFHGKEERDYQGRSWTGVPSELKGYDEEHECFIPKTCKKKFIGHSKGVQVIELFPKTGHLLLSGSMDGKCKIWDVARDRSVLRTYSGHTEGVRSVHMSNDGSQFLSSGFDRYVRLWDLETGQAVGTFSNRKMFYQVKFYPNDNNIFLCAASDNKVYQWDARTGDIVQEYNYHLQACNSITFFDEGRKFISTSDDKKMLVWEYDIPVPIKYIAEPDMHSVPSITVHPSGNYFVGQSMDNTLVTYTCGDKVAQMKKKTFRGHNNSGYACQVGFSPNGQFVASGDGQGKLHFWDWKTTKEYRKLQAHDSGPCICTVWHPLVPSWVFTCGWDGLIKLWD